ncbi:MAG: hypothetical protein KH231_07815 [Dialister sp.]|uniref:hypothetical protein n=1 Tax=Dialister sp. TaxID=1955814 RepID=UPI001DB0500B|nr:hypothetical protein [Dialister sp.]MBS6715355.1 hypothetical protein [Dialister sp.]
MENKIDMETVRCFLDEINAVFSMIMEDMEQENRDTEGYEKVFHDRANMVYIPALDLIQRSVHDLLKEVKEATA